MDRIQTQGDKKTASLADFQLLSVIGQGAFGKVLLVRHSATGKVHAMKVFSEVFATVFGCCTKKLGIFFLRCIVTLNAIDYQ